MPDLDEIDALYLKTSTTKPEIPAGEYLVRARAVERSRSGNGTLGLRVRFSIQDGPHAGRSLREDYWLTEAAVLVSKRYLETIGFENLRPSEILAFRDFAKLPLLLARVRIAEFEGRMYPEIEKLFRAKSQPVSTSERGTP